MLLCRLVFQSVSDHQVVPVWTHPARLSPESQAPQHGDPEGGRRRALELASPFAGSVIWTSLFVSLGLNFSFSEILEQYKFLLYRVAVRLKYNAGHENA